MLIITAEGGPPKWMPSTKEPVEVVLLPGQKGETRIRVQCGLSESEDYDLLVGMELIYKIGAQIDAWGEKLSFRTEYWREGGEQGELPVRFVKMEPKKALRATESLQKAKEEKMAGGKKAAEKDRMESLRQPKGATLGEKPITIVELFGGIGAGLAAALEAGLVVQKWILVEIDPKARRMAWHHADQLPMRYPGQISKAVIEEAKKEGAWDIRQLNEATVWGWGQVDLVVAGWECQGTSRAGKGRGMGDARTALLDELLQVLKWIQEGGSRCCYVVEHVDMEGDPREPIRATQEKVVAELGAGVSWDAALNNCSATSWASREGPGPP
ncbi:hypothetical protein CLOP_g18951 [Closterium sp. NIES-67]|nr:hypothetical protein CLOP_g18951 [Closterium sp. NIES-67]